MLTYLVRVLVVLDQYDVFFSVIFHDIKEFEFYLVALFVLEGNQGAFILHIHFIHDFFVSHRFLPFRKRSLL